MSDEFFHVLNVSLQMRWSCHGNKNKKEDAKTISNTYLVFMNLLGQQAIAIGNRYLT